jgi:hypothetical protein
MEARCDVLGDMEAWDEIPAFLEEARAYAEEAGLRALPAFADRLEGRRAVAQSEWDTAIDCLTRAADGFASLEARWEEARTRLMLAEALLGAGRPEDARGELDLAQPVFQQLTSVRELARDRELRARDDSTSP